MRHGMIEWHWVHVQHNRWVLGSESAYNACVTIEGAKIEATCYEYDEVGDQLPFEVKDDFLTVEGAQKWVESIWTSIPFIQDDGARQ